MKKMFRNSFLAVILPALFFAVIAKAETLPKPFDSKVYLGLENDLPHQSDPRLDDELESTLREDPILKSAIEKKEMSVALVDVTDINQPRTALVNENQMFYAASLPKIGILLGAFQKASEGHLDMSPERIESLTQMIRVSNNKEATKNLRDVGIRYVTDLEQSNRYRLYGEQGGLWTGALYDGGRDPSETMISPKGGGTNAANAFQVARYFYLLITEQLVSPEASRMMKEMFSKPGHHHLMVKAMEKIDPSAVIYRKSGSFAAKGSYCDGGFIERNGRTYIMVVLTHSDQGRDYFARAVPIMDRVIFK